MHAADSTPPVRVAPRENFAVHPASRRAAIHAAPEGGALPAAWPGSTAAPVPELATPVRPSGWRLRLRDRLIGGVVALALHLAVLFGFQGEPALAPVATVAPEEEIIPFTMPELEPPEAIEIVDMQDAPTTPQLAPPMQMDLPSTVAVSSFLQPVRPTLDPSLTSVGSITIPSTVTAFGAEGAVRLFELKELDRVPRRVRTVRPEYPHELKRAGVMGEVVLLVIIDVNGSVEVERVVSATNREFEAAAIKGAEQCVFEPPLRAGQRVKARYLWSIPFELSGR